MSLDDFLPYRLSVAAERISRALLEVYGRGYGLSREEWRLLFLLNDAGVLDSLEVAQRSALDKVQVSRAAGKLQAKGLITRDVHARDRRLRRYVITDAGRTLFAAAFGRVGARADALLGAMDADDRAALIRGLNALHQVTAEDAATLPGRPRPQRRDSD